MATTTLTRESLRILMIEDSAPDVFFYSDLLITSFGAQVKIDTISRLNAATELLQKNNYSLVIIDLNIVDSNGAETVRAFRKISGKDIPIIVLTGANDSEMRIQALLAGADDYLVKRRDDKLLCNRVIHHAVERYELIRQGHQDRRFI